MQRRLLLAALPFSLVATHAQAWWGKAEAKPRLPIIDVWKDPSCGCCKFWVEHMREHGFSVKQHETGNQQIRARLGLPDKLGSCHTAVVDGYLLEGHIPAEDVLRLLDQKPDAMGLANPGMPIGSPGMDGAAYNGRKDPYNVLLVRSTKDGQIKTAVFAKH